MTEPGRELNASFYARMDRGLGPRNAQQRDDLRALVDSGAGYALSDIEWTHLTHWSRKAANVFVFGSPVSAESRQRIENLRKAAHAFRVALEPVQAQLERHTYPMGRTPAEIGFANNLSDHLDQIEDERFARVDQDDFLPFLEPVPKGLSDWGTRDSKGLFRPSWSERCGPQPLAGSIVARDFDMKRI